MWHDFNKQNGMKIMTFFSHNFNAIYKSTHKKNVLNPNQ